MSSPGDPALARPRLRPLDVRRIADADRTGLVLSDPLGLAPGQAFVPEELVPIVAMFDGQRTVASIQARVRAGGQPLPPGFVADLVRQLDEDLLLESRRGAAAIRAASDAFLAAGLRGARHVGSAGYPLDRDSLRSHLATMVPTSPLRDARTRRPTPRGLVAPHIDLGRGALGYRAAYEWLAQCEPAELYVVFGTGHKGPSAPLTGLCLDWETPLGTVTTDRGFVDRVHAALGAADPRDVLLHRDEHSLEFQMLMLRHLLGEQPFQVAGFLCGHLPSGDGDPSQEEYVATIKRAFEAATAGRRVCYVAGADLAHVGPFFGDDEIVTPARLARLEGDDRARLARLERGAPGAFHHAVEADANADRICGTTPMFLTALLAGGSAELLHYGQACAEDGEQVVTFASLGYA